MRPHLYPSATAAGVTELDYARLRELGFRGLVFDIDNTLAHHGEDPTKEIEDHLRALRDDGWSVALVSDNSDERVARFNRRLHLPAVANAGKPAPTGLLQAVEMLGLPTDQVVVIGDQVFKDVLAANRAGLHSILVPYLRKDPNAPAGKRRAVEAVVLSCYRRTPGYPTILLTEPKENTTVRRNLSDVHPALFQLAVLKGVLVRKVSDLRGGERFATEKQAEPLPNLVSAHTSTIIKRGKGIDPVLQENKGVNITLASACMNTIVIHPGEVFSFWRLVGAATRKKGYLDGRVISSTGLGPGTGGGLCNLANTINLLVLHSPLEVTEFHTHSDALAPDQGPRQPLRSGTSVSYNYVDYRFRNTTDQDVQILLWVADGKSHAELRSEREFPHAYRLTEEDHHFRQEGEDFYRVSKIYRETLDRTTGEVLDRQLVWDNRSRVMFSHDQIPADQIRS